MLFSLHDAMDVDNEDDYKEMVKKIQERNPATTKILVDMKSIEKLPKMSGLTLKGAGHSLCVRERILRGLRNQIS